MSIPFTSLYYVLSNLVQGNELSTHEDSNSGDCKIYLHSAYTCAGSKFVSNDGSTSSKVSSFSAPPTPRTEGEILQSTNLRSFRFADLKLATRNFRPDSVLGEGGFGSVFKGWIDENSFTAAKPGTGIVLAVKRLNQESFQGHREWLVSFSFLIIFLIVRI